MSWFHMGDVISPSEMKSARSELALNQNTAVHLGNWAGVFIWKIFIPPIYDLASQRRDLGKEVSLLTHMNATLIFIVKLLPGEIMGRRDISLTGARTVFMNRPQANKTEIYHSRL